MSKGLKGTLGLMVAIIITFVIMGAIFSRVQPEKDDYQILQEKCQEKLEGVGEYRLEYVTPDQFRMWSDNVDKDGWAKVSNWIKTSYPDLMFEYDRSIKVQYGEFTIYSDYQEAKRCVCIWVERDK